MFSIKPKMGTLIDRRSVTFVSSSGGTYSDTDAYIKDLTVELDRLTSEGDGEAKKKIILSLYKNILRNFI